MSGKVVEDNPPSNILNGPETIVPLAVFNSEDFTKYASTMLEKRTCIKIIPPRDENLDVDDEDEDDENLELKSKFNEPKLYDIVSQYIAENQKKRNCGIVDFEKYKVDHMGARIYGLNRTTKNVNELRKINQTVENKPFIELLDLLKQSALENPTGDYLNGIRATMAESIFDKIDGLETGITDEWNLSKIGERFQMKSKTVMSSGYFLSPLTVEPFGLPKASYLIPFSRPMLWIIISPEGLSILNQFFKHIRKECETPINHCCYITDIEKFQSLGIEPTFIFQQPNEFVAIAPGCCYQTISFGVTVSEECNFYSEQVISSCMEMKRCVCKPVVKRWERIPRTVPALSLELEIKMMDALHGPNARLKNSVALRLMKELGTAEENVNNSNGDNVVQHIAIEQPHVTVIVDEPLQEKPRFPQSQQPNLNGIEPQVEPGMDTVAVGEPSDLIQNGKDLTPSHSEQSSTTPDTVLQARAAVEPSDPIQNQQPNLNGIEPQVEPDMDTVAVEVASGTVLQTQTAGEPSDLIQNGKDSTPSHSEQTSTTPVTVTEHVTVQQTQQSFYDLETAQTRSRDYQQESLLDRNQFEEMYMQNSFPRHLFNIDEIHLQPNYNQYQYESEQQPVFGDSLFMDQASQRSSTPCQGAAPPYFNDISPIHGDQLNTFHQATFHEYTHIHQHPFNQQGFEEASDEERARLSLQVPLRTPLPQEPSVEDFFNMQPQMEEMPQEVKYTNSQPQPQVLQSQPFNGSEYSDPTFQDGELPNPNRSFHDEQLYTNDVDGNGIDEGEEGRGETRPDYEKKARKTSSRKTHRSSKRGPRPLKPRKTLEKQHPREPTPQPSPAKDESVETTHSEDDSESHSEETPSTLHDTARRVIDIVATSDPGNIDLNEVEPININVQEEPPSTSATGTPQIAETVSQNETQSNVDEIKSATTGEESSPTPAQKETQKPETSEPIEEDVIKSATTEEEISPNRVQSQEPETLEPTEEDEVEMVLTMTDFRRGLCKQLQAKIDRKVRYEKLERKKINREKYDKDRSNRQPKELIAQWFKDKIRKLRQNIKNLRTIIKEFNMPGKVHRHYRNIEEAIDAEASKSQDEIALVNSRDLANILKELMKEKRHQNNLLQMFFVGIPMEQIIRDFFNRDDPVDRHLFEMAVRAALPKSRHEFYLDIANSKSKWAEHFKVPNDPDYRAPWKDWICDDDIWATAKIGKRKCPTPPACKSSAKNPKTEEPPSFETEEAMDFKLNGNENLLDPSQYPSEKRFQDMFEPDNIEPVNSQNENCPTSSTATNRTIILSEEDSQLDVRREAINAKNAKKLQQIQWDSPQNFIDSTLKVFELDYGNLKLDRRTSIATDEIGLCKLRIASLATLAPRKFISDDIVVEYQKLVSERSMRFKNFPKILTGHIQMKKGRHQREIDREYFRTSGSAQLVKPNRFFGTIIGSNHFILYVVDFASNSYFVYDPLGGDPTIIYGNAINRFNAYIKEVFNCEPEKSSVGFIQEQNNGYDCGICCIAVMDQTSRNIQPIRIPLFARQFILCELLCGKLFHEDFHPYDENDLVPLEIPIVKESSNSQITTQSEQKIIPESAKSSRSRSQNSKIQQVKTPMEVDEDLKPPPNGHESQQIVPESVKSSRSQSQDSKIQQVKTPMEVDEDLKPPPNGHESQQEEKDTPQDSEKLCACYNPDSKIPCQAYNDFIGPDGELDKFIINGNKIIKATIGSVGRFQLSKYSVQHLSYPTPDMIDHYFQMISERGNRINIGCFKAPNQWRKSRCRPNSKMETPSNRYVFATICVPSQRDTRMNHNAVVICSIPEKAMFIYDPLGYVDDASNAHAEDNEAITFQLQNIQSHLKWYMKNLVGNDEFQNWSEWSGACPEEISTPVNGYATMSAVCVMAYCEQLARGVAHINIENIKRRWECMRVELATGQLFRQSRSLEQ